MSDLVFASIPDCEALIASDMRTWFENEVKFPELFPKDTLKISTDHPFVALLQQQVAEGEKYSVTGFPSVTIIDTNFSKLVETPVLPTTMKLLPVIIDEMKAAGRNKFIMSKQSLSALEEAFKDTAFLRAEGYQTVRRTQMAIEVWALNNVMKGKIFDLVTMYVINQQRFKMCQENEVTIEEESMTGERSGIYNFDFGEVLYGGMIRFTVAYTVGYYVVKDFVIGAGVEVAVNGLVE